MSNSAIASVPKQTAKPGKNELDPRATRYGVVPIFAQQVSARDFYTWTIPANQVFPFRPFIGEVGQDPKGNELYRIERLPADQVIDLRRVTSFFTELPELAKLSEEDASRVAEVLVNPVQCPKYGIELGNECASCWLEYLHSDKFSERVAAELGDSKELMRAANGSLKELRSAVENSLNEARRLVDEAVREIDDPTKGKKQFYDFDYLNIYHTHAERPKYKTQTSSTDSAQAIADAISKLVPAAAPAAPAFDAAALSEMVAKAVEAATADLKAKLAEYEKPEETKKKSTPKE